MTLTWWEYEDLLEHLRSREDIWIQSEENPFLWLRVDDEAASCLALSFSPPADAESRLVLISLLD